MDKDHIDTDALKEGECKNWKTINGNPVCMDNARIGKPSLTNQTVSDEEWQQMGDALEKLDNASQIEKNVYLNLYGIEGGRKLNKANRSSSGIMPQTYDEFRASGRSATNENVSNLFDLGYDERANIYKYYFDDRLKLAGGSQALFEISDDWRVVAIVADPIFMEGGGKGAMEIRKALLMSDVKVTVNNGYMDRHTLEQVKNIVSDDTTRLVFIKNLTKIRLEHHSNDIGSKNRINFLFRLLYPEQ